MIWHNEDELLDWINDTEYGFAAYIYTSRLQEALRIGESIDAGMVGINRAIMSDPSAPSAVRSKAGSDAKAAGMGCGMREFQDTQYLNVDFEEPGKDRGLARGYADAKLPNACCPKVFAEQSWRLVSPDDRHGVQAGPARFADQRERRCRLDQLGGLYRAARASSA